MKTPQQRPTQRLLFYWLFTMAFACLHTQMATAARTCNEELEGGVQYYVDDAVLREQLIHFFAERRAGTARPPEPPIVYQTLIAHNSFWSRLESNPRFDAPAAEDGEFIAALLDFRNSFERRFYRHHRWDGMMTLAEVMGEPKVLFDRALWAQSAAEARLVHEIFVLIMTRVPRNILRRTLYQLADRPNFAALQQMHGQIAALPSL